MRWTSRDHPDHAHKQGRINQEPPPVLDQIYGAGHAYKPQGTEAVGTVVVVSSNPPPEGTRVYKLQLATIQAGNIVIWPNQIRLKQGLFGKWSDSYDILSYRVQLTDWLYWSQGEMWPGEVESHDLNDRKFRLRGFIYDLMEICDEGAKIIASELFGPWGA